MLFLEVYMKYLIIFALCFVFFYLIYLLIIISRKKGMEAFKQGKQLLFFKNAYKLDIDKLDHKKFANALALSNAFIIATTITVIEIFNNLILKLLVGFVILIPLTLLIYYVLGKNYKKKEGKHDV